MDGAIKSLLETRIREWRFRPVIVDGQARRARSGLRVSLSATQREGRGDYLVRVDNAIFPDPAENESKAEKEHDLTGNRGVRIKPWLAGKRNPRKRVVSAKVAGQVRDMMVAVVQGGTGSAAAIPGVTVAGKTGTAELVSTADIAQDAKNTTAWFVAFAPASAPRVAVAVMLVGAGQGGASAAPIAKRVLQAAL